MKIEKLQAIIDNAKLDDSIKDVLKKTIQELYHYNENVLEEIKEKVLFPNKDYRIEEIVCVLATKDFKEKNINLSPLQETVSDIIFINADYEEMRSIVGDDETEKYYEGFYWIDDEKEKFRYRFQFNNIFLEAQNLLFQLNQYYEVDNPILFSPFCQKAFRIIYEDEIPPKIDNIEYNFAKQNIPVIENATLFWNLWIEKTEAISCTAKTPYGANIKYKYIFEKTEEDYYYVLPQNNQTLIYDIQFTENGTEIWLDHDLESFILVKWRPVDWEQKEIKELQNQKRIFSNKLKRNFFTQRIYSLGDIEHALFPFRDNRSIMCNIEKKENLDKICLRYSAKYRNYFQKIVYKHLKTVYLKFQPKEEIPYFDDYVNYVLFYLEYHYPEIEWVGGK